MKNLIRLSVLAIFSFQTVFGQSISRSQILSNAEPYETHTWYASSNNIVNYQYCSNGGKHITTPPWVSVGANTSFPYCWGGFTSISSFDSYLSQGRTAGDICASSCGYSYGAEPTCAVGLDCSGFISRAWGKSSKYSTSTLPNISNQLSSFTDLQDGDMINKAGSHTRLIHTPNPNGTFTMLEAGFGTENTSGGLHRVFEWTYSYSDMASATSNGYYPYEYNNLSTTPALNNGSCFSAQSINFGSSCSWTSGTLVGATESGFSDLSCGGSAGGNIDVWYEVDLPNGVSDVTFQMANGSNPNCDLMLGIYSSCSSSSLIDCIDNNGSPNGPPIETLNMSNYEGQTVYLRVQEYGTVINEGNFSICVYGNVVQGCPDLVPSYPSVSNNNPLPGEEINAQIFTYNQGTAPSDGASRVGFYFSTDCFWDASDDPLDSDPLNVIQPGSSELDDDDIVIPEWAVPGQTYYILFVVDNDDDTDECSQEGNNVHCEAITIAFPPTCSNPSLSPSSENHNPLAFSTTPGSDDIIVNVQPNCAYTITGGCLNESWFSLDIPTTGNANSNGQFFINYSLDANTSTSPRTCSLNVNGSTFTVTQSGCSYEFDPVGPITVSHLSGATGTFEVETSSPCPWSLNQSNCNWLSLSQTNGTGDAIISYTVTQNNPNSTPRSCSVSLNGETLVITQEGCTIPSIPGNISGDLTVCDGANGSYSISPVSGATNYNWNYTGSGTPTGSNSSMSFSPTSSGTLTVTAENSCGTSVASNGFQIDVEDAPNVPTITGPTSVCTGESLTLEVGNSSSCQGCDYTWFPDNLVGETITVTPANTTVYTVSANNDCGSEVSSSHQVQTQSSITVTVIPTYITGCEGEDLEVTADLSAAVTNAQYTWMMNGAPYSSCSGSTCIVPNAMSNNVISVDVTFNQTGCFANNTAFGQNTISLYAAATANAGSDVTISPGSSTTLVGTGGNNTCLWTPSSGLANPNSCTTSANPTQTTTYTLEVTDGNGCTATDDVTVTVIDLCDGSTASLNPTIIDVPVDGGGIAHISDVTFSPSATGCTWEVTSGTCGSSPISVFGISPSGGQSNSGTVSFFVGQNNTGAAQSCELEVTAGLNTYTIAVNQAGPNTGNPPVALFTPQPSCGVAPLTVGFQDQSTGNPTSWDWFFNGASPFQSTDQHPQGIVYSQPGEYTVALTVTNSAGSDYTEYQRICVVSDLSECASCDYVGVENIEEFQFNIYPNPTSGILDLLIEESLENGGYELFNSLGQIVVRGSVLSERTVVDLSTFAEGIYTLRILDNGAPLGVKRVIVSD